MIYDTLTHHRKGRPLTKGFKMGIFRKKTSKKISYIIDVENSNDSVVFKNIKFKIMPVYGEQFEYKGIFNRKSLKHISHAGFYIHICNNSLKNIEINWNKTLYFENGFIKNNFALPNISHTQKNEPIKNQIIPSLTKFHTLLYPWDCRDIDGNMLSMPFGDNGIFLCIKHEEKEEFIKLCVRINEFVEQSISNDNPKLSEVDLG